MHLVSWKTQCMNHDVRLTHLRVRLIIQLAKIRELHQNTVVDTASLRLGRSINVDLPDANSSVRHGYITVSVRPMQSSPIQVFVTHTTQSVPDLQCTQKETTKTFHHRLSLERYASQCLDEDSDGKNGSPSLSWLLQHWPSASSPSWEHHIRAALFVVLVICDMNHTSIRSSHPTQSRAPLQIPNSHVLMFLLASYCILEKSASHQYIRQCCIIRVVRVNCISDTVESSSFLFDFLCHVYHSSITVCTRASTHAVFSRLCAMDALRGLYQDYCCVSWAVRWSGNFLAHLLVGRCLCVLLTVLQAGKGAAKPGTHFVCKGLHDFKSRIHI